MTGLYYSVGLADHFCLATKKPREKREAPKNISLLYNWTGRMPITPLLCSRTHWIWSGNVPDVEIIYTMINSLQSEILDHLVLANRLPSSSSFCRPFIQPPQLGPGHLLQSMWQSPWDLDLDYYQRYLESQPWKTMHEVREYSFSQHNSKSTANASLNESQLPEGEKLNNRFVGRPSSF